MVDLWYLWHLWYLFLWTYYIYIYVSCLIAVFIYQLVRMWTYFHDLCVLVSNLSHRISFSVSRSIGFSIVFCPVREACEAEHPSHQHLSHLILLGMNNEGSGMDLAAGWWVKHGQNIQSTAIISRWTHFYMEVPGMMGIIKQVGWKSGYMFVPINIWEPEPVVLLCFNIGVTLESG